MFEIKGEYTNAIVYADDIDQHAKAQVQMLCDTEACARNTIRVMPDAHAGKVGPIGLTMTLNNHTVMPAIVGNDIGCGVLVVEIEPKKKVIDFNKLDKFIRENLINKKKSYPIENNILMVPLSDLQCKDHIQIERCKKSFGTLGSGNHFIEIDQDDDGKYYLIIHSGSRTLGQQVYEYYMKEGQKLLGNIPYEMTYLTDAPYQLGKYDDYPHSLYGDYLNDVEKAKTFAMHNRLEMAKSIINEMKFKGGMMMESVHNYIDTTDSFYEYPILRKGAISARKDKPVIIPVNMKEGCILGTGKGNENWNYSAPHGSGRILMRTEVAQNHTVSEYKKSMSGIFTTSVNANTLDEAPFAYRSMEDIKQTLSETISIDKILRPVYNFKNDK